jgi:hypothetical protein
VLPSVSSHSAASLLQQSTRSPRARAPLFFPTIIPLIARRRCGRSCSSPPSAHRITSAGLCRFSINCSAIPDNGVDCYGDGVKNAGYYMLFYIAAL